MDNDAPATQANHGSMSRRDFLKGMLLLLGGVALAACSPQEAELVENNLWITPTPDQLLPANFVEGEPPEDAGLEAFLALSGLLTGVPDLSRDLGAAFLKALQASPGFTAGLQQLIEQAGDQPASLEELQAAGVFDNEQTKALADQIITAWYTGMVGQDEDTVVVTFVDSLAWKALHFTKPLTICATYGFWAEKPNADPPPVRFWKAPSE